MADATSTARTMWTLFEPVHAVTYFTADSRSAYEQAGLRGFWRGYFAGRAAPLGAAGPAVVAASFFNFAPAFVARAIPGVWQLATPEEALRARLAGATSALGRLLAGQEAQAAAAARLLWRAIGELDFSGRVLASANAALPVPDDDAAAQWLEHEREPGAPASPPALSFSPWLALLVGLLFALLLGLLLGLLLTGVSRVITGLPAGFRRFSPHNTAPTRLTGKNAGTSVTSVILPW